jgi:hypothetical protein
METKKQTSWDVIELSHLYHLVMWGYSAKEIGEILIKLDFPRTPESIKAQACNMRKYISKELGLPVQYWDVGLHTEAKYLKASNSGVPDIIIPYKRNKDLKPAGNHIPKTIQPVEPSVVTGYTPTIISTVTKEPDILDVMKMAKELGASEVEYKGMKIKY